MHLCGFKRSDFAAVCAYGFDIPFPVIIISLNNFVEVLRGGMLHYLMFLLQEHVMIAHVSPLARNILEICSHFVILLVSKELGPWKTDF